MVPRVKTLHPQKSQGKSAQLAQGESNLDVEIE